ncbi:leucyl aminopeptidase family protein [Capnocytophaga canimorsus]|uniref:leucyl aminopeptidase family protein n=1 Tax=Capnocytophaga canimorsus TaxID=28188 RepID=UPI000BB1F1A5|nr:leucyl aminopeptidase [Capnocytophaga canimorsus]ATA76930.1 peptidase M17 [Capnocytophaga canimorsus]PJI83939.1 leucyl aminopeptidase [Capnocytophaga canimorsus]STA72135.1 Cytosol aminopeptidase [Capnocytophaga canimorsus]
MKIHALENHQQAQGEAVIYVVDTIGKLPEGVQAHVKKYLEKKQNTVISIPFFEKPVVVALLIEKTNKHTDNWEKARFAGHQICCLLKKESYASAYFVSEFDTATTVSLLEGMFLSDYQFTKYKTEKKEECNLILYAHFSKSIAQELTHIIQGVNIARDLVNEPVSTLNTTRFSEEMLALGNQFGFEVNVLNKTQISTLKMGGLLGVNAGSEIPPTFNVLTWSPPNAVNKNPYVFVGKGVVYDTGGYNIKPGSYMDTMKSDMAGAAAVVGLFCAVAKNNLPVHIIGLIPATDNRVNSNAFVSDDILTMMNGTTVEVKNTDAEGRLILADALVYAQRYQPKLVIDLATLTGAAARITGHYGSAFMGNASEVIKKQLKTSGENVHERLVELPFWDEFADDLKSNIADIKNLGNPEGGASSAGKFLEHFTDYPWLHIDIAGSAFLNSEYRYYKAGATGVGVRLLYDFLKEEVV